MHICGRMRNALEKNTTKYGRVSGYCLVALIQSTHGGYGNRDRPSKVRRALCCILGGMALSVTSLRGSCKHYGRS